MDFNASISQAMAKTMEHSDFVFVSMDNLTPARWDSNFSHLKTAIKPNTLTALGNAPLQLAPFPDSVLKWAEEDIVNFESKGQTHSSSSHKKGRYHPYEHQEKCPDSKRSDNLDWKNIGALDKEREARARHLTTHHDLPRVSLPINGNYYIPRRKSGIY